MVINTPSKLEMRLSQEEKFSKMVRKYLFGEKINIHKVDKDLFIKTDTEDIIFDTYKVPQKHNVVSSSMLISLNSMNYTISGDIVNCDKYKYHISQIPPIDEKEFKEVKVEENVINFGQNKYFKYISKDGKEHKMFSSKKGAIGQINSEYLRGEPYDAALQKYASFWNYLMSEDPV